MFKKHCQEHTFFNCNRKNIYFFMFILLIIFFIKHLYSTFKRYEKLIKCFYIIGKTLKPSSFELFSACIQLMNNTYHSLILFLIRIWYTHHALIIHKFEDWRSIFEQQWTNHQNLRAHSFIKNWELVGKKVSYRLSLEGRGRFSCSSVSINVARWSLFRWH